MSKSEDEKHIIHKQNPPIPSYLYHYCSLEKIDLTGDLNQDKYQIAKALTIKSNHWEYEKEWRFIEINPKKNRRHPFQSELLEGIILGCEISDENRAEITKMVKGRVPKIKIYQAKVNDSENKLDVPGFD